MMAADAVRCMRRSSGGGGGGSSAKFWRVFITENHGATGIRCNVGEIEFRSTIGGPSDSVGGVAYASSDTGGSYTPAAAFDGNDTSTSWLSASAELPQWIGYEHISEISVAEIRLVSGYNTSRAPKDFEIQSSQDGVTWETRATILNEPTWTTWESRTYTL